MSKKARVWIGATLLIIIVFNYIVIALPLYKKTISLENKIRLMMIKQVRSGDILKNSEDNYIIDVLKKEAVTLDKKMVILNCVAVSVVVIIISWMIFGIIISRDERRRP